jgi:hypothetical protein
MPNTPLMTTMLMSSFLLRFAFPFFIDLLRIAM